MSNAYICDRCGKVVGAVYALSDTNGKIYDLCGDCADQETTMIRGDCADGVNAYLSNPTPIESTPPPS